MLRCKQVWNNWEQLRCVAHSPLFVGMTIALLFWLGTCVILIQIVPVDFACTKRFFKILAEAIISVRNARLCARCAIIFLKIKQLLFSRRLAKRFTFLQGVEKQIEMLLEIFFDLEVLFQQKEMRISWRLCNNSEIHLWLWKVWSLVVCSQSSFQVTRALKDDKNRQNTILLC